MILEDLVIRIKTDAAQAIAGLRNVDRAADKVGRNTAASFDKMGGKMVGAGQKMSMYASAPLLVLGGLSVAAAAKFETSMNQVQAAAGASSEEMKKLEGYAMEMGAKTMFSAGEAAEAMLELVKSGMTPAQVKGGALAATMSLAAAGGLELAEAATVTSNAMNMFGLEAGDASLVADALAGAANASSANVSDLAMALSQVGSGAANAGLSIQETAAALAAFSDKGIRGSDAGTSLKTMLANLVPSTDAAAAMMQRLGINFVNADGSMKSLTEIAQILQDKMGGLGEAERISAMQTMFGSDATRAATVLMQNGAQGIEKYITATNEKGNAEKMAEARTKGMAGAMERMMGSLETAGIVVGKTLAPAVNAVAGAIEKAANWVGKLSSGWRTFIVVVAVVVAAIGPLLLIFGKLFQGISAGMNAAKSVGGFLSRLRGGGGGAGAVGGAKPGGPVTAQPLGGMPPAATGSSNAALQKNVLAFQGDTTAVRHNTAAMQKLANEARQTAGQVDELGDDAGDSGIDIGHLGRKSGTAGGQVSTMGRKAGNTAGTVSTLGGASRNAKGSILGMDRASIKGAAGLAGLAVALAFTINQLSKLGNAIDQMADAAAAAEKNYKGAMENVFGTGPGAKRMQKQWDALKAKVERGEKLTEGEKSLLRGLEAYRKKVEGDRYKMPAWASAAMKVKGAIGGAWNWAFGNGGMAAGGIASGPASGYPMLLHGTEAVIPMNNPRRAASVLGEAGLGGERIAVNISNLYGTDARAARQLGEQVADVVEARLNVRARLVAATGF